MNIKDDNNLVQGFLELNKNLVIEEGVPLEVQLNTVIQNAARTLLSIQQGQTGYYAFRSDSTGLGCILKTPIVKKSIKPEPELTAVLPYFSGGKKKDSGVKALERQLDFYVRDRLKLEKGRMTSAQKSHEVIEFGELKFTYWEGVFYDVNVLDMVVIK